MIGRQLKQYRILERIGTGGMGEVYRAHDTRLDRDVAVKVLPQGALADEGARRRFRKEALALSRLSHPHIASLLDFDTTDDGLDLLVMELVSGPSLDVRLKRGPLPEKEAVRLGAQMARALVSAHEHGIVHRDLKPQNLRLTADGLVKVLDFGLARLAASQADGATTDTASGVAAGTPPYMSPEQLLGREVDARTDVYAAGVVLYELATGRRPFGEASGPQLVAKILSEDAPRAREVNPAVSPELELVILKATDKDRELRHQTARDLLVDLERLAAGHGAASEHRSARVAKDGGRSVATGGRSSSALQGVGRWMLRGLSATLLLAALAAGAAVLLRPGTPRITSVRTLVRLPGVIWGLETDGASVYYSTRDRLKVVPLAGGEAQDIPLTWHGEFSLVLRGIRQDPPTLLITTLLVPDGTFRGVEGQQLWTVPLRGGAPTRLEDLGNVRSAAWSPHGARLAWVEALEATDRLMVREESGGTARLLAELPRARDVPWAMLIVDWHPSGERLRIARAGTDTTLSVEVKGGPLRKDWRPPPHGEFWSLPVWTSDGGLFVLGTTWGLQAHVERVPWWRPWSPRLVSIIGPTHLDHLRFTPGGRQLVGFVNRPGFDIVRLDRRTRAVTPLLGGARGGALAYSPDGTRVAWLAMSEDQLGRLVVSRPDGSELVPLSQMGVIPGPPLTWSPDGRLVAFTPEEGSAAMTRRMAIYLASVSEGTVEPLTPSERSEHQADPCWSPDGRWIAYGPSPLGGLPRDEAIYISRVDLASRRVEQLAGSEGLWSPKCSRDGRILAKDEFARRADERAGRPGPRRIFYKVRDPRTALWKPLTVEVPSKGGVAAGDLYYATWSHDARHVYAYHERQRSVVRFDAISGRLETVFEIGGLGETDDWMTLDPEDAPLVHRDVSQREIVVMGWEVR